MGKSDSLILRAPEPTDIDRLYIWENDPEMWRYGYAPAPLSRHQIWDYVTHYDADPLSSSQLRFMMQVADLTVGAADLYNIDIRNRRAFVGIMTDRPYRRSGHALHALERLADFCRFNMGLLQLIAVVAQDNPASMGLFEKAGYKPIATLPSWVRRSYSEFCDAILFSLFLD